MVDAGSFKNGITIQYENGIWQVIEFQHVKPVRDHLSLELS